MHLECFEVFRTVVECGSVTKAAQLLHMTQSTASRHLQALENEYGGLLFERELSGLTLTELGKALYPYTCDLLSCHARSKEELLRLRRLGGGISVGATYSIGEYLLPRMLGEFARGFPNARIRMRIDNTAQVLDDLARQRIDIGFVEGEVAPAVGLTVSEWIHDELVLVCSPEHPFALSGGIDLAQLPTQPLLCREEGSGTRQVSEAALEQAGMLSAVTIAMELGSTQAIKSAIEAGLGMAFLSRVTIEQECQRGQLVVVSIEGLQMARRFYIVQRTERYAKYMVDEFLRFLHQRLS